MRAPGTGEAPGPEPRGRRAPPWLLVAGALFVVILAYLVATSFARPSLATFVPSPIGPVPAGDTLVVDTVTIDARDPEAWVFFDFSRRSVVERPGPRDWDLAARRYRVVVNGGAKMEGDGGALALESPWEAVREAPAEGYVDTEGALDGEPAHAVLERWYRYDFLAHVLEPRERTIVVRTAEGRYAKLRFLGYYCPEATPGCLTFAYAYQGDGSRRLAP